MLWDGRAKRPMMLFSDMGGIDIEEVAEKHPDHVGRGHLSNLQPIPDFRAKEVVASIGLTGRELTRATPILARLARLQRDYDMTLAEINPLARLSDGSFVALDAHMEMEDEAVPPSDEDAGRTGDRGGRAARAVRALRVRAQREGDRRGRPSRRHPGQGPRLRGQPRPRDRRGRRLPDADRRGPQPGRKARQLRRDRRQPLGREVQGPGDARC